MPDVDLDALARGYRHRPLTEAGRRRARRAAREAGLGPGGLAVDVGGGRGWHAAEFAATGARAVVVDRSPRMAAAAAMAPGVAGVVGDGSALPIGDGRAGLVYFHASIHYGDPDVWLSEATRVAVPGGVVWVWTFARDRVRSSFLARWFPTVGEIDARRFPDEVVLARILAARGAEAIGSASSVESVRRRAGDWVAAVRGGFVSTLQLVDAAEIERGLAAFSALHPDPDEIVDYPVHYRALWGRRSG